MLTMRMRPATMCKLGLEVWDASLLIHSLHDWLHRLSPDNLEARQVRTQPVQGLQSEVSTTVDTAILDAS